MDGHPSPSLRRVRPGLAGCFSGRRGGAASLGRRHRVASVRDHHGRYPRGGDRLRAPGRAHRHAPRDVVDGRDWLRPVSDTWRKCASGLAGAGRSPRRDRRPDEADVPADDWPSLRVGASVRGRLRARTASARRAGQRSSARRRLARALVGRAARVLHCRGARCFLVLVLHVQPRGLHGPVRSRTRPPKPERLATRTRLSGVRIGRDGSAHARPRRRPHEGRPAGILAEAVSLRPSLSSS